MCEIFEKNTASVPPVGWNGRKKIKIKWFNFVQKGAKTSYDEMAFLPCGIAMSQDVMTTRDNKSVFSAQLILVQLAVQCPQTDAKLFGDHLLALQE